MKTFLLIIVLLFPLWMFAEGSGGFSGAFLRIGAGARGQAMGNAQVAAPPDGFGAYYNPAALPALDHPRAAISYSNMSLDRRFNIVGFALPLPPIAGASLTWISSGVDNFRAYNSIGQDVGEVNHGLNAIALSFGVKLIALAQADGNLKNLPSNLINLGLTVKFLNEGLDDNQEFNYSGSGLGFDFGLLLRVHQKLSIGYQLKDVNASLASNTNDLFTRGSDLENAFPLTQKVGAYYRLPVKGLAAAYDFEWNDKGEEKHHFGVEIQGPGVAGRAGYDHDRLTFGGGLQFQAFKKLNVTLDYAFLDDLIDEGASHVFSWQFLF